jgi:putative spermidine/putrescine transport system ATP-binding protein
MAFIEVDHITHRYPGGNLALSDVSFGVEKGTFFSMLGPSGCGKSTLLNVIGGFLDPTEGSVRVDGADIVGLPPYRRNIGMVFQNYALFPHLSVFENVAYGLRVQKRPKAEIAARVEECLGLVHLEGFGTRMPHQLSGGQQQRVAIARALANDPQILMLDEPLGNLDAKLRKEMQVELRRIQRSAGVTTIMVTHDQEEAMTMSDAIVIMRDGKVQQVGSPFEVYGQPANSFVAGFLGTVNLAAVERAGDRLVAAAWADAETGPVTFDPALVKGAGTVATLRPESVRVAGEPFAGSRPVRVLETQYAGGAVQLSVAFTGQGELRLEVPTSGLARLPRQGDLLAVGWDDADVVLVEEAGEHREP